MLNKTAQGEGTASGATNERSILAADIILKGNIKSAGTVEVQGRVDGDIEAKVLVIGADGRVTGAVRAETVEIRGRLNGKASCGNFTLRSASHVTAEVNYEVITIESGAQIDGRFVRAKS